VSTESDVPTIAGASSTFLEKSFQSYISDERPAIESKYRSGDTNRDVTDMKKIAEQLSQEQTTEMAKYFAGLPFVAAKQDFDAAQIKIGEKIHKRKCEKCHEDGGTSAADNAGILAGQWTPYLTDTMKSFKNKTRKLNKGMKKKLKKLSDREWQALLHYYASQQG
ncbi:MAG: cytochrome c-553, partial [Gammaproteobacteria bacterium]|nr:cytochrome c-553 [Gammaproteobacteria bacterium]